jgi:hypothetical protein
MMAKNKQAFGGIKLPGGAGGNFVHGNQKAVFDVRRLKLPGLAHIEETGFALSNAAASAGLIS